MLKSFQNNLRLNSDKHGAVKYSSSVQQGAKERHGLSSSKTPSPRQSHRPDHENRQGLQRWREWAVPPRMTEVGNGRWVIREGEATQH